MNKEILSKSGYRKYNQPDDKPILYQKKVSDKKGIKYFINCYHYNHYKMNTWEFRLQIESKYGTIRTNLFNSKLTIENIGRFMENIWKNYGSAYYELFDETDEVKG